MLDKKHLKIAGMAAFALLALAACRPEEQGRPLSFTPGTFPKAMESKPLDSATLAELRQRVLYQSGARVGVTGAGGLTAGDDVRPPAPQSTRPE